MYEPLSYEKWRQAQAIVRSNGWKYSNCFLLPAELQRKIEARVLSLQWIENGLLLLEDAGSFYRCYYFFSPTEHLGRFSSDREIVVEFPFTKMPNSAQTFQQEQLTKLGFVLERESSLMHCTSEHLVPHELPKSVKVRTATEDDILEVLTLFVQTFDPRFAFLPTAKELQFAVTDNRVLVITQNERIVAALYARFEKTIASIRHVAVQENYRGIGLGKSILEAYHRKFSKHASAFQHWVDLHNEPAVAMYKSFGYEFSLRKANEYTLKPSQ